MRNYLRTLLCKWIDKLQARIKNDFDEPIPKEGLDKLIMTKEELDKLIDKDIWKKT